MEMKSMYQQLGVSPAVYEYGEAVLAGLKDRFARIDRTAEYNQGKVLAAMQKNRVNATHFAATTGYGYDDEGRDNLERVYADVFHTEAALVPQITCGTHALAVALSANLLPGDELLSPVGAPYDTLEEVIGIRESKCSLREYGVTYAQADLKPDGSFDFDAIRSKLNTRTRLITIQRSKGYATRPSFSVDQIGELIAFCKSIKPDVKVMVDNCYGEFVELREPSDVDKGVRGPLRLPALRSRSGAGGRRQPGPDARLLPGTVPVSHGGGRGLEGRHLRCGDLREAGLPVCSRRRRGPPRHHSGRGAGQRRGHEGLLPGHPGRRPRGQLRHPGALGHAGIRRGGHYGRRSLCTGQQH